MNLNKEDIALFFKLWFMLTYSINCKHKIVSPFERPIYGNNVDKQPFVTIRKVLWENPSFIDDFLAEDGATLSNEEKKVLMSWRTAFINDKFLVLKYLKKYSVLMPFNNPQKLYGVIGISDPFEVSMRCVLPRVVETTLLPFKGKIIYDSILIVSGTLFGPEMQKSFLKSYNEIKAKSGITESFFLS